MVLADFTAKQILAIEIDAPEKLFSSADEIEFEYRVLAKIWHPDVNKSSEASSVLAHINALHAAAKRKIAAKTWDRGAIWDIVGNDRRIRRISARRRLGFELGDFGYGQKNAAWVVDGQHVDLFDAAVARMKSFRYKTPQMQAQIERYLPALLRDFRTVDGGAALIVRKTEDVYLLADVVAACGGKLDPRHVAWIMNGVYNVACYLQWLDVTHNAIDTTTVFISPKHHSALLLGGWWYSADVGATMSALPKTSHRIAPQDMLRSKTADSRLDLAMIKAMGREILGDRTGMDLVKSGAPDQMVQFLRRPVGMNAHSEYAAFDAVLKESYGARRFVELQISDSDIYG